MRNLAEEVMKNETEEFQNEDPLWRRSSLLWKKFRNNGIRLLGPLRPDDAAELTRLFDTMEKLLTEFTDSIRDEYTEERAKWRPESERLFAGVESLAWKLDHLTNLPIAETELARVEEALVDGLQEAPVRDLEICLHGLIETVEQPLVPSTLGKLGTLPAFAPLIGLVPPIWLLVKIAWLVWLFWYVRLLVGDGLNNRLWIALSMISPRIAELLATIDGLLIRAPGDIGIDDGSHGSSSSSSPSSSSSSSNSSSSSSSPSSSSSSSSGPQITLVGPTPILRGGNGNYRVVNAPPGARYANWAFTGGGTNYNRPGNNNVANWSGTMVQGGTVSVDVIFGGNTTNVNLAVRVTNRTWTENLIPSVPLGRTGNGALRASPRRAGDLGNTRIAGIPSRQLPDTIPAGPNQGWNWVPVEPIARWTADPFTNDALYDRNHPFYRAHSRNPLPAGRAGIAAIRQDVEAHEGVIAPPAFAPPGYASHWQKNVNFLSNAANQINIPLEDQVSHVTTETLAAFRRRLFGQVGARIRAAVRFNNVHPNSLLGARQNIYFGYPYLVPQSARLRVGMALRLRVSGGVRPFGLISTNPRVAAVNAAGIVTAVARGNTIIRVTDGNGDIDEITVSVP